jgi:agmatine/peptidylarginine deiminase
MKRLPAEWETQDAILLSFPHKDSDWNNDLNSALSVFIKIASAICYKQKTIIICQNKKQIEDMFCYRDKISFIELKTDDTWIRDYGPISIFNNNKRELIDFKFNAWGEKYNFANDNAINKQLEKNWFFYPSKLIKSDFILEGGSIDSNGEGVILTTTKCILNKNRNHNHSQKEIEELLKEVLGIKQILWLNHGHLIGDDTDSHIDTLARFVNKETIVYVKCYDKNDEHYDSLNQMEKELRSFKTEKGNNYTLIPLPLPEPKYKNNSRLPATYANFLITNYSVIVPTYKDKNDKKVIKIFKELFPTKEIIPIDSLRLIEEGGSIHCSSMNISALSKI